MLSGMQWPETCSGLGSPEVALPLEPTGGGSCIPSYPEQWGEMQKQVCCPQGLWPPAEVRGLVL